MCKEQNCDPVYITFDEKEELNKNKKANITVKNTETNEILFSGSTEPFVSSELILNTNNCCIISESFKNKLEKIKNDSILIGDIIEDENNNKICISKILSDDDVLRIYGKNIEVILYNDNDKSSNLNQNMKFNTVIHNRKEVESNDGSLYPTKDRNIEIKYMTREEMDKLGLDGDGDVVYEDNKPIFVMWEGYKK